MLCSAAALPLAAHAQQIAKVPRVGWLSPGSRTSDENFLAFFHNGLRELGWVVGQNIAIEPRWAEERFERLPDPRGGAGPAQGRHHRYKRYAGVPGSQACD